MSKKNGSITGNGDGYKILEFAAENFKKLKVVNIVPDSDSVILTGENEQGKTAILQAIKSAFGVKESKVPIRKGEEKASVVINLGDFIITQTITHTDSYLKVTGPDGRAYPSPQALLNSLYNKYTIDPSALLTADEDKLYKLLKEIVHIETDIDELDKLKKETYDERTQVNREVKSLEAQFRAKTEPEEGLPEEETSMQDILDKIAEANEIISENKVKREFFTQVSGDYKSLIAEKEKITQLIKSLAEELETVDEALLNYKIYGKNLQEEVLELADPDIQDYNDELQNLESTNKKIREAKEYRELASKIIEKKQEAETLTNKIKDYEDQKQKALEEADFPIKGLGFSENGVTYKGLPLADASQEEKIRVGLAIAMAQNPKLKVILIRDGAFFDKKNFALVQEIAKEKGYQLWIERVDTGETGIIIEDGTVKSRQEVKPAAPAVKTKKSKAKKTETVF
jgi:hypothetical protein